MQKKNVFRCNLYDNPVVYVISKLQNTIYQMRQLKITKQVTNRETASLDKYLQEIGKVELITADEEVILAQKIRSGDKVALEKLSKPTFVSWFLFLNNIKTKDFHCQT